MVDPNLLKKIKKNKLRKGVEKESEVECTY